MADKVYNRNIRDMEEELLRPISHMAPARSNELFVKQIPEGFQYWLNIPDDKFREIQSILTMFLNYTLLGAKYFNEGKIGISVVTEVPIAEAEVNGGGGRGKEIRKRCDDIQDNALYRRSVPAAHCVFGVPLTINACSHSLGLVLEKILDLGHPKAINVFVSNFLDIFRGQGTDIYWRENLICASEDDYKKMSEKKSSAALMVFLLMMQLFSTNKTDYSKFVMSFGVYYVIRDDYCNLVKQEAYEGHEREKELQLLNETSFCEDLTDGKFSWPVIHALNSPEGNTIIYMLKQHTRDLGMKHHFLSLLERLGSLQYTRDVMQEYDRELRAELARLGGNPHLEAVLDSMKNWAKE